MAMERAGSPVVFLGGRIGTQDLPATHQPLTPRLHVPRKPSAVRAAAPQPLPRSLIKRRETTRDDRQTASAAEWSLTQLPASQFAEATPATEPQPEDPLAFVTDLRRARQVAPDGMLDLCTSRLRSENLSDVSSRGPLALLPNPYRLYMLSDLEADVETGGGLVTHSVSATSVTIWDGTRAREVWSIGEWHAAWKSFERVRHAAILRRCRARYTFEGWRASVRRRRNTRHKAALLRAQRVASTEAEALDPIFVAATAMIPSVDAARELSGWIRLQSLNLEQVAGGADSVELRLGVSNSSALGDEVITRVDRFVEQVASSLALLHELLVTTGLRSLSEPNHEACRFVVETYGRKHYMTIAGNLLNRRAPLDCVAASPRNARAMLPAHPPIGHARGEKGVQRLARWHRELQPMAFEHASLAVINAHMLPAIRMLRGADWIVASALLEAPIEALRVLLQRFEEHDPLVEDFLLLCEVERLHEPPVSTPRLMAGAAREAVVFGDAVPGTASNADLSSANTAGANADPMREKLRLRLVCPPAAELVRDLLEQEVEALSSVQLPSTRPELADIVAGYMAHFGKEAELPRLKRESAARRQIRDDSFFAFGDNLSEDSEGGLAGASDAETASEERRLAALINEQAIELQAEIAWEERQRALRKEEEEARLSTRRTSINEPTERGLRQCKGDYSASAHSSSNSKLSLAASRRRSLVMSNAAAKVDPADGVKSRASSNRPPQLSQLLRLHLLDNPPRRLTRIMRRLEAAIDGALQRALLVAISHDPFIAAASLPAGASQALAPPLGLSVIDVGCVRISGRSLWPNDSSNFDVNPLLAPLSLEELADAPPASLVNNAAAAGSAPLWRRPRLMLLPMSKS